MLMLQDLMNEWVGASTSRGSWAVDDRLTAPPLVPVPGSAHPQRIAIAPRQIIAIDRLLIVSSWWDSLAADVVSAKTKAPPAPLPA
jgi:hypothetical protein